MNIIELAKEAGFNVHPRKNTISSKECLCDETLNEQLERFAALVRAERQWVDLTDDEMWNLFISKDWTGEPLHFMSAVIAAFKEKNK